MEMTPRQVYLDPAAPAGEFASATMLKYDAFAQRITHWMLSNPGKPLSHCARELHVSPQYVYFLVSTDTFQTKYKELCGRDFKEAFVTTLADKLRSSASLVVDKIVEQVELNPGSEYLLDAGELLINAAVRMDSPRPQSGAAVQINNFPQIPQDVLANVQQQMLAGPARSGIPTPADQVGSVIHEHGDAGLPAAK